MKWLLTNPGLALSGRRAPSAGAAHRQQTESIRSALIEALQNLASPGAHHLMQRIQYAGNAERLWYLRPEAMSVLASSHGEVRAREELARISMLFQDVLPAGLASQLRATGPGSVPRLSAGAARGLRVPPG
ncbi:MAG: hypothetical protein HYX47_09255 [Burkholderiales bacterium]|nr:hypothetical protein [Burkholderiales bacterium]